jgi:hypothetical protein
VRHRLLEARVELQHKLQKQLNLRLQVGPEVLVQVEQRAQAV